MKHYLQNFLKGFWESHYWLAGLCFSLGMYYPSVKVLVTYLVLGAVYIYIRYSGIKNTENSFQPIPRKPEMRFPLKRIVPIEDRDSMIPTRHPHLWR